MTSAGLRAAEWDAWVVADLALLREPDGFRPVVSRDDLQIGSRPEPGDPNLLFRWRLPVVNAAADVVFEGFVNRLLEFHREWTSEYVGGHVVATPAPQTRILYQSFDPGRPGIARRDLCSAEVVRRLPGGAWLASYRSVDAVPPVHRHVRIDWWGAALCTPLGPDRSELVYLDRENQGGRFPAWLMNRMMPGYLVKQAEQVRRFFDTGGPPELRDHPTVAPQPLQ